MDVMDLTNLRRWYKGKDVRTERPATPEERERGLEVWGGEGVVEDIYVEGDMPFILMDWGMAWVITPCTKIIILEECDG